MVNDMRPSTARLNPRSGANVNGERRSVIASPAYPATNSHSPVCRSSCTTYNTNSSVVADEDVKYAASVFRVNQRSGMAESAPYVRIGG